MKITKETEVDYESYSFDLICINYKYIRHCARDKNLHTEFINTLNIQPNNCPVLGDHTEFNVFLQKKKWKHIFHRNKLNYKDGIKRNFGAILTHRDIEDFL